MVGNWDPEEEQILLLDQLLKKLSENTNVLFLYAIRYGRVTQTLLECEKRCSHLVEIGDKEESDFLASTFLLNTWTGGNDHDIEDQYRWSYSNVTITFTAWNTGEPSVGYPAQAEEKDCIDLLRNGKWNDRPCSYLNSFICEMPYGL
ncbi:collectin-12-like [Ostrea edulis]|uniref:collectin-12-like n=1 Tax=Ostrea edulis TaxID=37623 RepID=UPI0024AF4F32|nr:collectin-12-like [Ostrea edulis]XP_056014965.1 collectin-12-like [Ostrea edulis]